MRALLFARAGEDLAAAEARAGLAAAAAADDFFEDDEAAAAAREAVCGFTARKKSMGVKRPCEPP